jgi:hypothetical protein
MAAFPIFNSPDKRGLGGYIETHASPKSNKTTRCCKCEKTWCKALIEEMEKWAPHRVGWVQLPKEIFKDYDYATKQNLLHSSILRHMGNGVKVYVAALKENDKEKVFFNKVAMTPKSLKYHKSFCSHIFLFLDILAPICYSIGRWL